MHGTEITTADSDQTLRSLWPTILLAKKVAALLGRSPVLFRTLSTEPRVRVIVGHDVRSGRKAGRSSRRKAMANTAFVFAISPSNHASRVSIGLAEGAIREAIIAIEDPPRVIAAVLDDVSA